MIAVALLTLRADFRVSTTTATWLISGFYLAGAIGMPLMGRLADQFGPRRIFSLGLLLVGLTGALAPVAPTFGWLLLIRIVQAFGTAAAYPAGLAIMRARDRRGRAPAGALGAVSVASSVSAALGPVLGGGLVALAGWPAIFLVNVPVTVVGLVLARRWLPADPGPRVASGGAALPWWAAWRTLDLPGVALFSGVLAGVLGFLLSLSARPLWSLLPCAVLAAILLLLRERRVSSPFLDVRLLAANRPLVGVYAQFAAVNLVFYAVFFGLPLWLEEARRFAPDTAGLLLLPVAGVGVLVTPPRRTLDRPLRPPTRADRGRGPAPGGVPPAAPRRRRHPRADAPGRGRGPRHPQRVQHPRSASSPVRDRTGHPDGRGGRLIPDLPLHGCHPVHGPHRARPGATRHERTSTHACPCQRRRQRSAGRDKHRDTSVIGPTRPVATTRHPAALADRALAGGQTWPST
jgi:MFS family permease